MGIMFINHILEAQLKSLYTIGQRPGLLELSVYLQPYWLAVLLPRLSTLSVLINFFCGRTWQFSGICFCFIMFYSLLDCHLSHNYVYKIYIQEHMQITHIKCSLCLLIYESVHTCTIKLT